MILIDGLYLAGESRETRSEQFVSLFVHEGWHVVIAEHGESGEEEIAAIRATDSTRYVFAHLAVEGINEYRVERAMAMPAPLRVSERDESIRASLDLLDQRLAHASQDPAPLVNELLREVMGYLVELAAHELAHGGVTAALEGDERWERLVGEWWRPLCDALRTLPSAAERDPDLRVHIESMTNVVESWLTEQLHITPATLTISEAGLGVEYLFALAGAEPQERATRSSSDDAAESAAS